MLIFGETSGLIDVNDTAFRSQKHQPIWKDISLGPLANSTPDTVETAEISFGSTPQFESFYDSCVSRMHARSNQSTDEYTSPHGILSRVIDCDSRITVRDLEQIL